MNTIATHKQYLFHAAKAFCLVCTNNKCKRDRESESTCALLLDFRHTFKSELAKIADKTCGKTTKVCKYCGKEKPISEFYPELRNKDGHKNICKECLKLHVIENKKKRLQRKPSAENTSKIRKLNNLRSLLGKTQAVTVDSKKMANLRYKLDDEYRNGLKEYSKRMYYEENYYLAKKYLKRYDNSLKKAQEQLEQIRASMENSNGRNLYILKRKESSRIAKIESYKYKMDLCRSILEGKYSLTKEDIEKAGIFHVKSSLLNRIKTE